MTTVAMTSNGAIAVRVLRRCGGVLRKAAMASCPCNSATRGLPDNPSRRELVESQRRKSVSARRGGDGPRSTLQVSMSADSYGKRPVASSINDNPDKGERKVVDLLQ